jgi:hypothetical protein
MLCDNKCLASEVSIGQHISLDKKSQLQLSAFINVHLNALGA